MGQMEVFLSRVVVVQSFDHEFVGNATMPFAGLSHEFDGPVVPTGMDNPQFPKIQKERKGSKPINPGLSSPSPNSIRDS